MTKKLNPFQIAQRQLDAAAEILKLDPAMHAFLREPLRELHVTLPVKMDDLATKTIDIIRLPQDGELFDENGPVKIAKDGSFSFTGQLSVIGPANYVRTQKGKRLVCDRDEAVALRNSGELTNITMIS